MKMLSRIVLVAVIACAIYFATIGSNQFYRLLDVVTDFFDAIGSNYLKK
jgi:hypothetical protein